MIQDYLNNGERHIQKIMFLKFIKYIAFFFLTFLLGTQTSHAKTEVITQTYEQVFATVQPSQKTSLQKVVQPNIGFLKEKAEFVAVQLVFAQNSRFARSVDVASIIANENRIYIKLEESFNPHTAGEIFIENPALYKEAYGEAKHIVYIDDILVKESEVFSYKSYAAVMTAEGSVYLRVVEGGSKSADEWLTLLKGNNYVNLRKHIFEGNINDVTGCHYRSAVDGVNIRFVENTSLDGNSLGVLKGDIEFRREIFKPGKISFDPPKYKWTKKKIPGGDPQTFFPSTWSKDKILEECSSALANPKKQLVLGKTRMFEAESNSGIFMRWYEDANGNVTSIFPEF